MTTVPSTQFGAVRFGAAHEVDEVFLELVCADEQLLRAEFDAIIAQEWPSRPPPAGPSRASAAAGPDRRRQQTAHGLPALSGTPRHPQSRRWRRQRSPP